jgi:hypothetical protein
MVRYNTRKKIYNEMTVGRDYEQVRNLSVKNLILLQLYSQLEFQQPVLQHDDL